MSVFFIWHRLATYLSGLCAHGRCASVRERRCAPMETQFAIVVYRRRWNGFLILLCSLALLFPPPATGSGHSRASLCLSRGPSLYHPPDALGPPVSQAKYAPCASWPEVDPGRYIVIKAKEEHHAFAWCSSLVSGGYLSFRPLRTWSLRVGPGGSAVRRWKLSSQ